MLLIVNWTAAPANPCNAAEIGFEVSRKIIDLDSPIKEVGTHNINVKLFHEVTAGIIVEVQGEDADGNIVEVIEEPEPETVEVTEAELEVEEIEAAEPEAETAAEESVEVAEEAEEPKETE